MKMKSITIIAALLCSTAITRAQEAPPTANSENHPIAEEIVVTALLRANSVQDVAASIDVIGGEALTNSGIASVEDLKTVVPSLIIQRPPNNTVSVSVRGLGSAAGPVSFDQSISLFVDGVYAPRGAEFLAAMFDIEKVEVVKGTQAAVLGKNTSLGGVLLTTRKPGFEFAVNALAQYEFENKSTIVSGGADIPLSDSFAIRAAAQIQDVGGYMPNRFDGRQSRANQAFSGRLTARWEPTPDVEATLSYQYEDMKSVGVNAEPVAEVGNFFRNLFTLAGRTDLYDVTPNRSFASSKLSGPSTTTQPSHRVNGTLNWQLGDYAFTAVTGWSKFSQSRNIDRDYVVGDYFSEQVEVKGRQFSQELRLTSPAKKRLNFIVGALFVDNALDQALVNSAAYPVGASNLPFPLFGSYRQNFSQDTTTYSGFGQVNLRVVENLLLSGGLRYTSEKKKGSS
ncbi:MAG: TonB-dependent receptor plug domain-containing protein, partial [Sphingobium sp.]